MAESENQTENSAPTSDSDATAALASPTKSPAAPRPKRAGVVFAILLALIAIACTAYLGYRIELQTVPIMDAERERLTQLEANLDSLQNEDAERASQQQSQVEEIHGQLNQQAEIIEALSKQVSQADADQTAKIDTLIDSVSSVYQNLDQRQDDWELGDVALLLLVGAKQLEVTRNSTAVLPVWQLAREQVGQSSDPKLLVVQAQLAKEIEILQEMEVVDVADISTALLELVETIDDLPLRIGLRQLDAQADEQVSEQPEQSDFSGVRETLDEVWTDLKSLVRVKKVTDPSSLPLNPHIRNDLLERLKLSLSAAQIAALRGNAEIYKVNLSYVISTVEEYFDSEKVAVVEYSASLKDLLGMPVVSPLPDVSISYSLLQEIIKQAADA